MNFWWFRVRHSDVWEIFSGVWFWWSVSFSLAMISVSPMCVSYWTDSPGWCSIKHGPSLRIWVKKWVAPVSAPLGAGKVFGLQMMLSKPSDRLAVDIFRVQLQTRQTAAWYFHIILKTLRRLFDQGTCEGFRGRWEDPQSGARALSDDSSRTTSGREEAALVFSSFSVVSLSATVREDLRFHSVCSDRCTDLTGCCTF